MSLPAASAPVAAVPEGSWAVTRTRIALFLILLYAGASTLRWLHIAAEWPGRPASDEISLYESRFEGVRSLLPARGIVGYLGRPEPKEGTPRPAKAAALLHFRRYLLAQYALAPLLLVPSTEPELVIGNFDTLPVPPAPAGFRVLREFGNGVVLFRRSRP